MQDLHALAPTRKDCLPALRVAVVDAFTLTRDALRCVLEAESGFVVVGAASHGGEAVQLVGERRPHVLLLDVAMPGAGGLEVLRELRLSRTTVPTVVLADVVRGMDAVIALTLGARGVVLMDTAPSVLREAVRAVAAGSYWIGRERVDGVAEALRRVRDVTLPSPAERLTPRELEVVGAVLDGATNRDIGLRLNLSLDAVRRMLHEVFGKLGVSRRVELAVYAARHLCQDAN